MTENFEVEVDGKVYVIDRVLQEHTERTKTYRFETFIDERKYELSATLTIDVIQELSARHGINALDELTNVLLTEFKLEIAKIRNMTND